MTDSSTLLRCICRGFLLSVVILAGTNHGWCQVVRTNAGFRSSTLPRGDDEVSSPATALGFRVNFFGQQFDQVYVNNNGNISFRRAWTDFTPQSLDRLPVEIIAPFWADVDTSVVGSVTYGRDAVNGRPAFGATYTNVGYFDARSDKTNTFQVVLIDRSDTGAGNFDIEMNYGQIRWEVGDFDGGIAGLCQTGPPACIPASVGFSNGSGQTGTYSTLAGSLVPGSFLDGSANGLVRRSLNSGVSGRLVYSARAGSIAAPISITSITPNSLPTGSGATTVQLNGAGFAPGMQVYFDATPLPNPLSVSASQISVQVPANLLSAARIYQVSVRQGSNASNAVTFTVTSSLSLSSLNPNSLPAGSAQSSIQLNGSGFGIGALVFFDGTALPTPGLITATQIVTQIPATLLSAVRTYQVTVRQSGATSNAIQFTVTSPTPAPPISITGVTGNLTLGSSTNIGLQLASPATVPLTGRIDATFVASALGVPAGYRDPAMQFASGGTSIVFTVAQGQSVAVLPSNGAFNFGTVAGTVTFRITNLTSGATNFLPSPAPATTATFARTSPVVTPGSVRIINTPGGFSVELQGYSTPRDLSEATFQFTSAGNARIEGETTFTVSLSTVAPAWFAGTSGQSNGSRFSLSVPFTSSADPNLVQSATVTLRNSVGNSLAVTGGR